MNFSDTIIASLFVLLYDAKNKTYKELIGYMLLLKQIEKKLNLHLKYIKTMKEDEFNDFKDLVNKHTKIKQKIISLYKLVYDNNLISPSKDIARKYESINQYIAAIIINYIKSFDNHLSFFSRLNYILGENIFFDDLKVLKTINYKNRIGKNSSIVYGLKKYFGMLELFKINQLVTGREGFFNLFMLDDSIKNCNNNMHSNENDNTYSRNNEQPGIFDLFINMNEEHKDIFKYILSDNFYYFIIEIGMVSDGIFQAVLQLIQRLWEDDLFIKVVLQDQSNFRNLNSYIEEVKKIPGIMEGTPKSDICNKINHLIDKIKSGEIELSDGYSM